MKIVERPSGFFVFIGLIICAAISFAAGVGIERQVFSPGGEKQLSESLRAGETTHAADHIASERVRPIPVLAKTEGRVMAEFEHMDALMLGVNELIQYHPETLIDIVKNTYQNIKIVGIVANDKQEQDTLALLKKNNLPESAVDFFTWPVDAMWVRDYAPYFIVGRRPILIDFDYGEKNRDLESHVGVVMAATYGFQYDHCRLTFEGGNLCTNGKGLCISTTRLADRNAERGYTQDQVGGLLHDHFHFDRWIRLSPLSDEPTGHADMFCVLVAPNKCLMSSIDPNEDATNATILDQNAQLVKGEQTDDGPMEVDRIPMPSHKDGVWRTYTNVIFANGVLLVPQYPEVDPKLDQVVLEIYRNALPKWKIVGVDCTKLVVKRGALHCISRHIPVLPTTSTD